MSDVLSEDELIDRIKLLGHEYIDAEHFLKYANEIIASHKALQRRVEWTRDFPEEDGFYWWKRGQARDIVNVVRLRGRLMVDAGEGEFVKLEEYYGTSSEWAGPLEPPHEARG